MILININKKVIFYMYKQYSNIVWLVKYIYVGNIQQRKEFLLRFGVLVQDVLHVHTFALLEYLFSVSFEENLTVLLLFVHSLSKKNQEK